MADVATVELAFRLSVAAAVVVAPAVLFLGLWRLLKWLRDDELVATLAERGVVEAADTSPSVAPAQAPDGNTCPDCGAVNRRGVSFCRECLSELN